MSTFSRICAAALTALVFASGALGACPPAGESRASLFALKAARWQLPDQDADPARQMLAIGLLDCLADPDPVQRDELAFEALSAWLRGGRLSEPTLQAIRTRLVAVLGDPADAAGFRQPFAALVLAELARVDRLKPFLSADERAALVDAGARYLANVRDYRGFDSDQGWRHGVAHGADLMLQLSLNPGLAQPQAEAIRSAVAAQVPGAGEHAYRYGEGERLMAPVFYLARRDWWTSADWEAWFDGLGARRAKSTPTTQTTLAQRHNLGAFLSVLYVSVQESADPQARERLLPGLRKAIKALD